MRGVEHKVFMATGMCGLAAHVVIAAKPGHAVWECDLATPANTTGLRGTIHGEERSLARAIARVARLLADLGAALA